ncbi:hypothetical protein [Streptomyces chilikensis]|uniref:Uncharacterized protein n=1 Tax=Streptomyces chilikensis TaxID=1194079 RepID=A0ABV3EJB1_9ACTN
MGAIQEPTEAMGPYRVEIRGESFYLTRVDCAPDLRKGHHEAAIPATDVPTLIAALD